MRTGSESIKKVDKSNGRIDVEKGWETIKRWALMVLFYIRNRFLNG